VKKKESSVALVMPGCTALDAALGYYHGRVDGLIGPETEGAVRWFRSVDKLPVTGQLDDWTLKALEIS
jgi:peptidoglycan hydrolase-like protein with peptidoglycan-binding domain